MGEREREEGRGNSAGSLIEVHVRGKGKGGGWRGDEGRVDEREGEVEREMGRGEYYIAAICSHGVENEAFLITCNGRVGLPLVAVLVNVPLFLSTRAGCCLRQYVHTIVPNIWAFECTLL